MSALLVTFLSLVTISHSASIEFGFNTAKRDESTNDENFTGDINMTLYWEQYRFQCGLLPTEFNTYYFCNTSNIMYVDYCDTSESINPVSYGLQIDGKDSSQMHIASIIIKESDITQTKYTFTSFCEYISIDTVSDHCSNSTELETISIQNNHNYLFTFNHNTSSSSVPQLNMILTDEPAVCTYDFDTDIDYGYDYDFETDDNEYGDTDTDTDWYPNLDDLYEDYNEDYNEYQYDTNNEDSLDSDTNDDIMALDLELVKTGHIIIKNMQDYTGQMVSFYLGNLDLTCGGIISNVAISDNNYYKNKWINYTETEDYNGELVYFIGGIGLFHNPMRLPINIQITKTINGNSETLIGNGIIMSFDGGEQFDFGDNFCISKDRTGVHSDDTYDVHDIHKSEGSVKKDEKHTNSVLIIIGIVLLILGIVGVYWVYNRHRNGLRQKLLFMVEHNTLEKAHVGLVEI